MKDKKEAKLSARAMESAMILRLFKDALESERPIVSRMRWEPEDEGEPQMELGAVEPHPSFGDSRQAASRLGARLCSLLGGDKSEGDRKPIIRMRSEDGSIFDFSMESFDRATLSDDGGLMIMAGALDVGFGSRADMELLNEASLRLYGAAGFPLRRDQALFPIRELVDIQRREREAQALREMEAERSDGDAMAAEQASAESGSGSTEVGRDLLSGLHQESASPAGWGESRRNERMLMAIGELEAQDEAPGGAQGGALRWGRRASDDYSDRGPKNVESSAADQAQVAGVDQSGAELDFPAPEASDTESSQRARNALLAAFEDQDEPAGETGGETASRVAGQAAMDEALARVNANLGPALQSAPLPVARSTEPSAAQAQATAPSVPLASVKFLPVAFEPLPDGYEEIAFSVEPSELPEILAFLSEIPEFEARLAHKEGARMRLALAAPRGSLSAFTPLVERYAKGGVMIRRAKGK